MSREEDDSDTPPPNLSRPIVDLYLDDVVVHNQPSLGARANLRFNQRPFGSNQRPLDWSAAFQSLSLDDSHSDLAPARRSVPVLAHPARNSVSVATPSRISVPVSAPAVVETLPVVIPRRFPFNPSEEVLSALGYPQDKATITVDIRNRSLHLTEALGESP